MAYTEIPSSQVQSGEPVKAELAQQIRTNDIDFNTRLSSLETSVLERDPLFYDFVGRYSDFGSSQTGVLYDRITNDMRLTAARLIISTAGTAGTTEVDVLYKRGAGAWTSIFSTKPSVVYTAGDMAVSSNAVISTTDLEAGDFLRIDITGVQTGGNGAKLQLEWEVP